MSRFHRSRSTGPSSAKDTTDTATSTASAEQAVTAPSNQAEAEAVEVEAEEPGYLETLGAYEGVGQSGGRPGGSGSSGGAPVDPHSGLGDSAAWSVAESGTSGPGSSLPHLDVIQASFGAYDVSGVKAHTDGAASAALGANAYTVGSDVVFGGAPSLQTAAEEATHAVVQGAGKGPGGVGKEGDSFEQHADQVASRVARGESAEDLLDQMTGGKRDVTPGTKAGIQREQAPVQAPAAAPEAAAEATPEAPSTIQLDTPMGKISIDVARGTQPGATVTASNVATPLSGLTFEHVSVSVDQDFKPTAGSVRARVNAGQVSGVGQLQVQGGVVSGEIDVAADLAIGRATGKASMTSAELRTSGTIAPADLRLCHGLTATGSSVTWTQANEAITANGAVNGDLGELGTYALDLAYAEGQVSGNLEVGIAERTILGTARILQSTVAGSYGPDQAQLTGNVGFGIGEWATGTATDAVIDLAAKSVTGQADVLVQEVSRYGMTLHSGTVGVGIAANTFTGGEASLDIAAAGFRGGLENGRYDPATDAVSGQIQARLEEESKDLGPIVLRSATGRMVIENNQPTSLDEASAEIGVKVGEDADAILGRIDTLAYDIPNQSVSGEASANTTAPIELAGGAVSLGFAEASVSVSQNQIGQITGAAGIEAGGTPDARLLSISGTGTFDAATATVTTATGEASLVTTPLTVAPGFDIVQASGIASVTNNELDAASLDAGWRTETFEGTVAGAFDGADTSIDGEVEASVHTPKQFGSVASLDSGSGLLEVQSNAPMAFAGEAQGTIATDFTYETEAIAVDIPAAQVSGSATIGLDEGKTVELGSVGKLDALSARGEMVDNEITKVTGEMDGQLNAGGRPLLDFEADGSFDAPSKTVETATAVVSLAEGETRELGGITLDRLDAIATITQNEPALESANVGFHNEIFEGSIDDASFDLATASVSGSATATLKEPQSIGGGALEITAATGTAEVTDNELSAVRGSVEGTVRVGENAVDFTAQDIELDTEAESLSGMVTASTRDYLDILPGRVKAKVNEAEGEMKDNALTRVSGGLDVKLGDGSKDVVAMSAEGEFAVDEMKIVEASGDAELLQEVEVFDGAVALTEMVAEGRLVDNQLESASVFLNAELRKGLGERPNVPTLGVEGSFSQNANGEFDIAGSASIEQFDIIQEDENGRHLAAGLEGSIDTAAKTFDATGTADFSVNESFGGDLEVGMDQEFDPGLTGTLEGKADLVQENELFSFERTVVWAPIPPIFGASLDASLSMSVGELSVEPSFTLTEEWKPLSDGLTLPDFETRVGANWGVQIEGGLHPYLYGGIRNGLLAAAIGAKGGGVINANADVNADVGFKAQGGEFSGDVDLGVDLTSALDLKAGVFAELGVMGWDVVDWEKDDLVQYTLADLFTMQWSKKFTFGDAGPGEEEGGQAAPQQLTSSNTNTQTSEASTEAPTRKGETASSNDVSAPGGPSIDGAGALESLNTDQSESAAQGDEEMSALEAGMQALESLQGLYEQVGRGIDTLKNVPFGVFQLIWDIFKGRYDFNAIKENAAKVMESFDVLMDYVAPMLSGWFQTFYEYIQNSGQALLNALFGDSGAFRRIINDGVTIQSCPPEMLVELLEGALWDDFWTSESDEAACMTVLNVAVSRGMADVILTPERTRRIFDEMDHRSAAFKNLVTAHAPASVLRQEVERYTGHWWLSGDEERAALSWIQAAANRGILRSVLTQEAAEDIYSGMDGSRRTAMRDILRAAGYRL